MGSGALEIGLQLDEEGALPVQLNEGQKCVVSGEVAHKFLLGHSPNLGRPRIHMNVNSLMLMSVSVELHF